MIGSLDPLPHITNDLVSLLLFLNGGSRALIGQVQPIHLQYVVQYVALDCKLSDESRMHINGDV